MRYSEELLEVLKKVEYSWKGSTGGRGEYTTIVLGEEKLPPIETAVRKWFEENLHENQVENEILKQRVAFLEEMVSKSNFAPFVEKAEDK